jgi:ABC-type transport system substrate-binding protein
MVRITLASALTASALLFAPSALAQTSTTATTHAASPSYAGAGDDPNLLDPTGWSAAAMLGFAFNDIGFGIGARGGYTLDSHVYLGGTLLYHFGQDDVSAFLIGAEGGYDFLAGPVVIRPYLGLGVSIVSVNVPTYALPGGGTAGGGSASSSNVALWPGCTVLYPIPGNERWFVGGDARILIINDFNTFALFALGGLRF